MSSCQNNNKKNTTLLKNDGKLKKLLHLRKNHWCHIRVSSMPSKLILTKYLIPNNLLRQSIFMSAEHFVENWNFNKYCRESLYINSVLRCFPAVTR